MQSDEDSVETIAPVLAMIGQQARLDPPWTCQMIEAVAGRVLPAFYMQAREKAETDAERLSADLKLALLSGTRAEELVQLAHTNARMERLREALYWIDRAIEIRPDQGEYFRFKASILERMRSFDEALAAAKQAERLGADRAAIRSDIERIQDSWLTRLKRAARGHDSLTSLRAHLTLLEQGHARRLDLGRILLRLAKLFVGARPENQVMGSAP